MVRLALPFRARFHRALKQPKLGAFQTRRASFAQIPQERMRPRWWPFNAPRPRRNTHANPSDSSSDSTEADDSTSSVGEFADWDAIHPAVFVDVEDKSGRVMSWLKTPTSKVREPAPYAPVLPSIDTVVSEPPQNEVGAEISRIIQQAWELHYEFVRQITPGNQGRVDIYTHKPSGKLTIVKTIKTQKEIPLEAVILQDFLKPHPNLVEMQALFYDPELHTCNIVMEYCSGGDLFDLTNHWLYKRSERIPEIFLLHLIASMGEALGFLHLGKRFAWSEDDFAMPAVVEDKTHVPILHRDIKLENIFLRWSPSSKHGLPDIVLGDFGGAVLESGSSGSFGTSGYFPPEVLRWMYDDNSELDLGPRGAVITKASDMYTFGVTLCYMMLWGNYQQGMNMEPAFRNSNLRNWPLLFALLQSCLAENPCERPPTGSLFNLAPILRLHVQGAYACGVRMPDGSWPEAEHSDGSSNEGVQVPSSVNCQSMETPLPSYHGAKASHSDSTSHASIHSAIFVPTQRAREITIRPPKRSTTRRISTALRVSALYELVEGMANNLLINIAAGKGRGSANRKRQDRSTSQPLDTATPQSERAPVVSKFSDDSDLD